MRNARVHAALEYPGTIEGIFDFQLKWRECVPSNFAAPEIADIDIKIGDDPRTIEYGGFNKSPCEHG